MPVRASIRVRLAVPVFVLLVVVALFVGVVGVIGCNREQSGAHHLPVRFARQYMPFVATWQPESLIPSAPQRSPQMKIWEVSDFDPHVPPTPEQQKAADDMVQRCFDAAVRHGWFDREKGLADGFLTKGSDTQHHRNDAYVLDDIQLDPDRPEYLMYYEDPDREGEYVLTGFMFLADAPRSHGRQFAGPLAIWHYHVYTNARCWKEHGLLSVGMVDESGRCEEGEPYHRSPEMVHVWLIDHPRGAFSTGMTLPQDVLRKGLEMRREEHGF